MSGFSHEPIEISHDSGPDAKLGTTSNPAAAAVAGTNTGNRSDGFIAGPNPFGANQPIGVFGRSDGLGVFGFGNTGQAVGVFGNTGAGAGIGVVGHTSTGVGVQGQSNGSGLAGKFTGDVAITGNVLVEGQYLGNIQCSGDIILLNQDLAEDFEIAGESCPDSGSVMVIDDRGKLSQCEQAYDKRVAGVIAGAVEFKPAIVLGRQGSEQNRLPIALVGKVSCKVDATYSPIEVGDLLTTSPTVGHAMRASDAVKAFGSVIGKALRALAEGQGSIPILIALQ